MMGINPVMTLLQAYLSANGIRQSDFAKAVKSTQATISKLASGVIRPGLELAVLIERETSGSVPASCWVPDTAEAPVAAHDTAPPNQEDAA